ncbi:MAG: Bax inhibitor-1/YccA family protein [Cellvibrionaceae bacterium]
MQELYTESQTTESGSLEISKILRNTYTLLALCFAFSAVTAGVAAAVGAPNLGLLMLVPYFICLWMVEKTKNSAMGLFWVFALTGWLGFSIGPMLSFVVATAGYEPILLSLGGTAAIFFGLSGYVLTTRKDLSFMGGFLCVGILVAFIAAIANFFLNIQGMALAVSCMFLLLSSGVIAWYTSVIIHGGETNYISATVMLFVAIYNVFTSLLHLILAFTGDD